VSDLQLHARKIAQIVLASRRLHAPLAGPMWAIYLAWRSRSRNSPAWRRHRRFGCRSQIRVNLLVEFFAASDVRIAHARLDTTMTISAQPTPQPSGHPHGDRPTTGLDAHQPFAINAFDLLDHRTRARTVTLSTAPPGRYLSVDHEDEVLLIPLDKPIMHLGRGLSADVRLEDPQVSRRHAIVAQRGDGVRVLDDRSSNGTFVNGREVTVDTLADGDVLRLGRIVLRYIEVAPPVRARPVRRFPLSSVRRRRIPTARPTAVPA
jgi:hypothetical protein